MSVATTIPCIKLSTTKTTTSSSSSCSSTRLLSHTSYKPCMSYTSTIRSSQTEGGPVRRPTAPSPAPAAPPLQPQPQPPTPPPSPSPFSPKLAATTVEDNSKSVVITLEFQRAKAKELQDYFKQKKLEEADQGPAFGFVPKNEIGNGRWSGL
ncbi:Light-harvesting complex-like protein OHP2 chloroplastic [Bienertia sinuspersici]